MTAPLASDRLCDYCALEPAVWRCQCANPKCRLMTCQAHKTIAQNPARIPIRQNEHEGE